MKYILLIFCLLMSLPSWSREALIQNKMNRENFEYDDYPTLCGEYQVAAFVRLVDNVPSVVVHEGTLSQFVITLPFDDEIKLSAHLDLPIFINVIITRDLTGFNRAQTSLVTASPTIRIPNPINPHDTGFKFIKAGPCEKK